MKRFLCQQTTDREIRQYLLYKSKKHEEWMADYMTLLEKYGAL